MKSEQDSFYYIIAMSDALRVVEDESDSCEGRERGYDEACG